MLHVQTYDVDVKHIQIDIDSDTKREYTEDGKIVARQTVRVKDTVDTKEAPESTPDGLIKPYGLDSDGAYDVEVKEKIGDPLIQNQIDTAMKDATPKTAKRKVKYGIHD